VYEQKISNLWSMVNRPGIKRLIEFLKTSDFYDAPCSIKHHLAKLGGLAEHSLNVYVILRNKCGYFQFEASSESIIICALGHDLCKVNYYQDGGEPAVGRQLDWAKELVSKFIGYMPQSDLDCLYEAKCIVINDNGVYKAAESLSKEHAGAIIGWLKDGYRPGPVPEFKISWSVKDQLPLGHGEKSVSILQDFIPLTIEEKLAIRWHMAAWDLSKYSGEWAYNNASKMTPLVALLASADFEASNILEREKEEA
jgi:hypothetical protein